jgi:hypothetical protein
MPTSPVFFEKRTHDCRRRHLHIPSACVQCQIKYPATVTVTVTVTVYHSIYFTWPRPWPWDNLAPSFSLPIGSSQCLFCWEQTNWFVRHDATVQDRRTSSDDRAALSFWFSDLSTYETRVTCGHDRVLWLAHYIRIAKFPTCSPQSFSPHPPRIERIERIESGPCYSIKAVCVWVGPVARQDRQPSRLPLQMRCLAKFHYEMQTSMHGKSAWLSFFAMTPDQLKSKSFKLKLFGIPNGFVSCTHLILVCLSGQRLGLFPSKFYSL